MCTCSNSGSEGSIFGFAKVKSGSRFLDCSSSVFNCLRVGRDRKKELRRLCLSLYVAGYLSVPVDPVIISHSFRDNAI